MTPDFFSVWYRFFYLKLDQSYWYTWFLLLLFSCRCYLVNDHELRLMRSNIFIFQGDFRFGGAEVVGVNLANAYCELGYNVTLVVLKRRGGLEERILSGVTIFDLNTRLLFSFTKLRRLFTGISEKTIVISTIRNLNVALCLTASRNENLKLIGGSWIVKF